MTASPMWLCCQCMMFFYSQTSILTSLRPVVSVAGRTEIRSGFESEPVRQFFSLSPRLEHSLTDPSVVIANWHQNRLDLCSLGWSRFEVCQQILFHLLMASSHLHGVEVWLKWSAQQNRNLFLLDCAGLKPADGKCFSIGTHFDIHS